MSFIHLHNHTEYSLLDGAMQIDRLTELAARYKMSSLAITDHGNLFGAIEFYRSARKHGVKPIIGIETYVAPKSRFDQSKDVKIPESSFHLTLLCEDEVGYRNLVKLSSLAYIDGFYYKPRIDKELLREYHQGLIGLSGCFKGEISYRLNLGDNEGARKSLGEYQEIFGKDSFYLELMRMGIKNEEKTIEKLLKLSQDFDAPVVATNDCHYFNSEDYKAHDVLLCIGTKRVLSDRERLKFDTHYAYFRSPEEMMRIFEDLPEAITNTMLIAERCNLQLDTSGKDVKLPSFPRPSQYKTDFDYLHFLALEGIQHRFPRMTPGIEERLEYELNIIKKTGLSGYFLIVRDIIHFAKEQNIPVGPGRGSAVGSLVLYALNITDVDPLQYNLIFERFLNPDRVSLPDVDVDFGDVKRDKVIEFIKNRYGEKNVTQVITFGTMQARAVVRDVGRVLGIAYNEVDKLAKLIPFQQSINEALASNKEFKIMIESKPEYVELIEIAKKLEGLARHPATHAAGVVITPKELIEYVPLYKSPEKGDISTQYAKNSLEDIGILKMDILGLRTLTVIEQTLEMLQKNKDVIVPDDEATYNLLKKGETIGVFQLESHGMQDLLKAIEPERFEDLIAIIALYRPGPMGNINPLKIIENKEYPDRIKYAHPALQRILKETYGTILYQEQVMQIAAQIAGFTFAEADNLRRAMAKKIPELMDENRKSFIAGAVKNGITKQLAEDIFKNIAPFAGYGFNKSHAAAYAVLAYQTAFLKTHFAVDFILASLNSEINNTDRLWVLIRESRRLGINILPPDINESDYEFKKESANIRYGLGALKNIGKPNTDIIMKERDRSKFKSFFDFKSRTKNLNKKSVEALVKSGAFNRFEPDIAKLLDSIKEKPAVGTQTTLFGDEEPQNNSGGAAEVFDKPANDKEAFGFYFSEHPLDHFEEEFKVLGLTPVNKLNTIEDGQEVIIGGILGAKKIRKDKNNRNYAIVSVEDFEGVIDVFVFSEVFERFAPMLKADAPLVIKGRISGEEDKRSIRAENIIAFSSARGYYKKIYIECKNGKFNDNDLSALKDLINNNAGHCEIWFNLAENKDSKDARKVRSRSLKIDPKPEVIERIREIFGPNAIRIFGQI